MATKRRKKRKITKTKPQVTKIQVQEVAQIIDPLKLTNALLEASDIFQRSWCKFFLLGNTLKTIVENNSLVGNDFIHLGIFANEIDKKNQDHSQRFKEVMSQLKNSKPDVQITDTEITFEVDGIKVKTQILNTIPKYFENLDICFFEGEVFNIPNPVRKYLAEKYTPTEEATPEEKKEDIFLTPQL